MISTLIMAALPSCMSRPEAFAPSEHMTGARRNGEATADYEVVAQGRVAGDTKVWSKGAFEQDLPDDRERTLLHVAFLLDSTSAPLELEVDEVALEQVDAGSRSFAVERPAYVEGAATSEAGSESVVHMYFALPSGVEPQEVDGFRVRWKVVSSGQGYEQRTPFLEEERPYGRYHRYYYPYTESSGWPMDPARD